MKVWVIDYFAHNEMYVYASNFDPLEIKFIQDELEYLELDYQEERSNFLDNIQRIKDGDLNANAFIDERVNVQMVEVRQS